MWVKQILGFVSQLQSIKITAVIRNGFGFFISF